jgi:hypothetical protein
MEAEVETYRQQSCFSNGRTASSGRSGSKSPLLGTNPDRAQLLPRLQQSRRAKTYGEYSSSRGKRQPDHPKFTPRPSETGIHAQARRLIDLQITWICNAL